MLDAIGNKSGVIAAQDIRVAELMRAYQRALGHRPTMLERHCMRRAALLSARAESAAGDPSISIDEVSRIDDRACQARAALAKVIKAGRESVPPAMPKSGGGTLLPSNLKIAAEILEK
jgi:hypothetical protein